MKKTFRILSLTMGAAMLSLLVAIFYLQNDLPSELYIMKGQSVSLAGGSVRLVEMADPNDTVGGQVMDARLLGVFSVKSVALHEVDRPYLVPCGEAFGLKMLTSGVMVVAFNNVAGRDISGSPAQAAGLCVGDVITCIDGVAVHSSRDVATIVRQSQGASMTVELVRDADPMSLTITPVQDEAGVNQLGLWVRDSSAGIGTMTYYNPTDRTFAGLGHGVCDVDTGEILPLGSGEVVEVSITGAVKGKDGSPGELLGEFRTSVVKGTLLYNTKTGIYGKLYEAPNSRSAIPIAFRQEIQPGPAQILTTIDGTAPQLYEVEIEQVNTGDDSSLRNMIIRITDETLLEATGGIVQGMSGSPILQNGYLVGAVTHVFVNNPTRGYGIFIENMLDLQSNVAA